MGKIGTQELRQLFAAVITMGNACGLAFEDKKIGLGDLAHLMAFAGAARDLATDVDFKLVMPEFKDLDDEEMGELMEMVEENFDIPEEQVEDKVKQILGLAARFHSLVSDTIHMVQNPEAMG